MEHDYLEWTFRLIAAVLVMWAIGTISTKVLRATGVVPYKPFASYEDYLEAAVEMDLDEFVPRAKATPPEVKRKPPEQPIRPAGLAENPELGQVLGTGIVALISCMNLAFNGLSDVRQDEKLARKFPLDRWFRDQSGDLVRVVATLNGVVTCACEGGVKSYLPSDLKPAVPRLEEWWGWKDPLVPDMSCYQIPSVAANSREHVEKGWIVPVNFGKGDKKRPDVATTNPEQEKSRGWFRWKVNGELVYRAADYASGWRYYNRADGSPYLIPSPDVEPAYPKMGEWWAKNPCTVEHLKVGCWHLAPVCWPYTVDNHDRASVDAQAAECGCLVPVNFGKGLEKKSGVA